MLMLNYETASFKTRPKKAAASFLMGLAIRKPVVEHHCCFAKRVFVSVIIFVFKINYKKTSN